MSPGGVAPSGGTDLLVGTYVRAVAAFTAREEGQLSYVAPSPSESVNIKRLLHLRFGVK